jgi:hypothetical protein
MLCLTAVAAVVLGLVTAAPSGAAWVTDSRPIAVVSFDPAGEKFASFRSDRRARRCGRSSAARARCGARRRAPTGGWW